MQSVKSVISQLSLTKHPFLIHCACLSAIFSRQSMLRPQTASTQSILRPQTVRHLYSVLLTGDTLPQITRYGHILAPSMIRNVSPSVWDQCGNSVFFYVVSRFNIVPTNETQQEVHSPCSVALPRTVDPYKRTSVYLSQLCVNTCGAVVCDGLIIITNRIICLYSKWKRANI